MDRPATEPPHADPPPPPHDDPLYTALARALPWIARVTDGIAMLTDRHGQVLAAVDQAGRAVDGDPDQVHDLCQRAGREDQPLLGPSHRYPGAEAWALPVGPYVLAASNCERAGRESQLRLNLQSALPLIAKVAGGEAILFNQEGRRLMSMLPDGSSNTRLLGQISEACRRTMESGRPDVGVSRSSPQAMAVRIPLFRDFGFGFNNVVQVGSTDRHEDRPASPRTARYTWDAIIGRSPGIRRAIEVAKKAARTQAPVCLLGESGTGKELLAQAIHNAGARSARPFVAVNCAALPPTLIESTLFGYEDGAFTGARRGGQPGLFEQATGGTLLLDEVSELELPLQAKLLRVLQEQEVTRVGGQRPLPVDVRIICTTNRDLTQMAAHGEFRSDLYYRLHVVDILLPALRDRAGDIPLLVKALLPQLSLQLGKLVTTVDPAAMDILTGYAWPGNVRELRNCLERAITLADDDRIRPEHLPDRVRYHLSPAAPPAQQDLDEQVRHLEREVIVDAVRRCGGNKLRAARLLGISPATLWRKLRAEGGTQPPMGRHGT